MADKKLPELTKEQVEILIEKIRANLDLDSVNYDNICCADDGVSAGIRVAINSLLDLYGLLEKDEEDEDEDEDEELEDE